MYTIDEYAKIIAAEITAARSKKFTKMTVYNKPLITFKTLSGKRFKCNQTGEIMKKSKLEAYRLALSKMIQNILYPDGIKTLERRLAHQKRKIYTGWRS